MILEDMAYAIKKLDIQDGDVFVCRMTEPMNYNQYRGINDLWEKALKALGVDALLLILPSNVNLAQVRDEVMNEYGWYRAVELPE